MKLKISRKIPLIAYVISLIIALAVSPLLRADEQQANPGDKLDKILQSTLDYSPGAILLVEHPKFSYKQAVGLADKAQQQNMQPDATLRLGSITKTYIAALTLIAEQKGLLSQGDKISQYLSQEVLQKLPPVQPTIRQLLNHSSGIPDYYDLGFYLFDWDRQQPITPQLVIDSIAGESATMQPGESFSYSNSNYHLLALILEKVFQQPLTAILSQELLQPQALHATYYDKANPPDDTIHGYGALMMPWNGPLFPWVDTYDWRENSGPDGGMFASAADVNQWLRTLYSSNGKLKHLGKQMTDSPLQESKRKQQGLGTEILLSKNGQQIIGHTGAIDGYLSAAFYIPDLDTSLVLHVNYSDADGFSQTLGLVLKTLLQTTAN